MDYRNSKVQSFKPYEVVSLRDFKKILSCDMTGSLIFLAIKMCVAFALQKLTHTSQQQKMSKDFA